MKRIKAFTLAEVLIALGVIGVVSALTLPSLVVNHQKDVYVTSLKKISNELSQAAQRKMTDMNVDTFKDTGVPASIDAAKIWVKKYLNVVKSCESASGDNALDCLGSTEGYRMLNKSANFYKNSTRKKANFYVLADGAVINIERVLPSKGGIEFMVDINGSKKPNIGGRDVFSLTVYNNGIVDDYDNGTLSNGMAPVSESTRESMFNTWCSMSTSSGNNYLHGCFGKILNDNWEMKY